MLCNKKLRWTLSINTQSSSWAPRVHVLIRFTFYICLPLNCHDINNFAFDNIIQEQIEIENVGRQKECACVHVWNLPQNKRKRALYKKETAASIDIHTYDKPGKGAKCNENYRQEKEFMKIALVHLVLPTMYRNYVHNFMFEVSNKLGESRK